MGDLTHVIDPHRHGIDVYKGHLATYIVQSLRVKPIGFDINTVGHSASSLRSPIVTETSA
jgi:hypothetical protein